MRGTPFILAGSLMLLAAGIGGIASPDAPLQFVIFVCSGAFGCGIVIGRALVRALPEQQTEPK